MASSEVIGDSQEQEVEVVVASLPLGVATTAQLLDIADPVNLAGKSGKKEHAMYIELVSAGVYDIVIAAGPLPADTWCKVSTSALLTPVV